VSLRNAWESNAEAWLRRVLPYRDDIERDGLAMTFHSQHRPLEAYSRAFEAAGLMIEALREVTLDNGEDRWSRIPRFLHLRARRSC
jgi:hypothetical protein